MSYQPRDVHLMCVVVGSPCLTALVASDAAKCAKCSGDEPDGAVFLVTLSDANCVLSAASADHLHWFKDRDIKGGGFK